jgi:hypothetical protein
MNVASRAGASTLHTNQVTDRLPENSFSHVATTGVSGAEYQNGGLITRHKSCRESGGRLLSNLDLLPGADFPGRGLQA